MVQRSKDTFEFQSIYDLTLFTFSIRKYVCIYCLVPVAITHASAATGSRKYTDPSLAAFPLQGAKPLSSK